MASSPAAGHGSNSNSDNGDYRKKTTNASAALQGATLAFASQTRQKQPRNSGSPERRIPQPRQPAGRAIHDGARRAALIADAAAAHNRAGTGADEGDDEHPVSTGTGAAVKDRIQLFAHPTSSGGGSTAGETRVPQLAESLETVTSAQNNDQTGYRKASINATIVTQPKIGPEYNTQRIAAKLAVDRSAAGSKARSGSPSRAASAAPIGSPRAREYQEFITHEAQRVPNSPATREEVDIGTIVTISRRDKGNAPPDSEVIDAGQLSAAQNMPTQQKYGVNTPPPLPNRSVMTRDHSLSRKMDSEPDQGSHPPPPPPPPPPLPRRDRTVTPPPALPPRSFTAPLGKEKPPPPAPRQSASTASSTIDRPLAPRKPLPSLPHQNPRPSPLPHVRASPLRPQHSGVSESALADAIAASTLASRRTPSPSKDHSSNSSNPPPLPPSRRSRSRSFLQVSHSGNRSDRSGRGDSNDKSAGTPSPNKATTMKRTMRAPALPEPDFAAGEMHRRKEHGRIIIRTHPHKHREGDRKRWRDKVTAAERKRYEGVWAANKGLFVGVHEQVNIKDRSVILEETVSSMVVRDIWTRSRLPTQMLEQIWNIVSHHAYGLLSREEFVVGMWLIDQCLKGHKLPVKVSQSVWDSVRVVSSGAARGH
ncbi:increased rDNA silencing protein IRS4 [Trichophyton equinum CBS 127.97]|uniref:Increased rDNA silencing protein IRS4 n=1 Tax=Trichophyton equinum (strain ATCC MYA-4606 / CBS 127.97) TaxID=559882 RepID=F2PUP3_TRIEC|nr:increased rDNA silencing protein IRS4 [Trichophyton equinum CBS 127.97]